MNMSYYRAGNSLYSDNQAVLQKTLWLHQIASSGGKETSKRRAKEMPMLNSG